MLDDKNILHLYDEHGNFKGVFVPAGLWQSMQPVETRELPLASMDMQGFKELMDAWTFHYSYDPSVRCPHCGTVTENWQTDPQMPFLLNSANIGGLLVFHCKNCGSTIRHKYFRRHMQVECSVPDK